MSKNLSASSVMNALEDGRDVTIGSSTRTITLILLSALVIGIFLLAMLTLILSSSAEQGTDWALIAFNFRVWACVLGIIGCFVFAPISAILRLRRRESIVLSPTGVALARRGELVPNSLLPWNDIEKIVFERPRALAPRVLSYVFTENAARRFGISRGMSRQRAIGGGFELSHRHLYPIFLAAHEKFSQLENR